MILPTMHNEKSQEGLPEGLYVGFFHGRNSIDENLDDWGFAGPVIGPLKWWHTTYDSDTRAELVEPTTEKERKLLEAYIAADLVEQDIYICNGEQRTNGMFELRIKGDCAEVGGKYYGDWSVFYIKEEK